MSTEDTKKDVPTDVPPIEAAGAPPEAPPVADAKTEDVSANVRYNFSGVFAGKPVVDVPAEPSPAKPVTPETAEKAPELPDAKNLIEELNKLSEEEQKKLIDKLEKSTRVYQFTKKGEKVYVNLKITKENNQWKIGKVTYKDGKEQQPTAVSNPEKIKFREWKKVEKENIPNESDPVTYRKSADGKVVRAKVSIQNGVYTLTYEGGKSTLRAEDFRMYENGGQKCFARRQPPRPKPEAAPSKPAAAPAASPTRPAVPVAVRPAAAANHEVKPAATQEQGPTGKEVSAILRAYNEGQLKELKRLIEGELKGVSAPQGNRIQKDFPALYTSGGHAKFRGVLPKAIDVLLAERQFPWLQRMTKENAIALRNIIGKNLHEKGGLSLIPLAQVTGNGKTAQDIIDRVSKGQGESLLAALDRKIGKPEK